MKKNKKLAIVLALVAGLMSSTAMAATEAGTASIGAGFVEAVPGVFDGKKDFALFPMDGTMTSDVVQRGGTVFTLDEVLENFPDVYTDFIQDFAQPPSGTWFTPREVTIREAEVRDEAGVGLVAVLIASDIKIRELPYENFIPGDVRHPYDPVYEKVVDFRPREVIAAAKLDRIATAGGGDGATGDKVPPERAIMVARADIRVNGGDVFSGAVLGGSVFFDPTVGKLKIFIPGVGELLLSEMIAAYLKELKVSGPGGDAGAILVTAWEQQLEDALDIEKKIDAKNIISPALISEMNLRGIDTKNLVKNPTIAHLLAEIPEDQYSDVKKLSEEYGKNLSGLKLDDAEGTNKILSEFSSKLASILKLDDKNGPEVKGLVKEIDALGGLKELASAEQLKEINTKLVWKDFLDPKFIAALQEKGARMDILAKIHYVSHFFAEIPVENRSDVMELSTKYLEKLADPKSSTGEFLGDFVGLIAKESIKPDNETEATEIEHLANKISKNIDKLIPPSDKAKYVEDISKALEEVSSELVASDLGEMKEKSTP